MAPDHEIITVLQELAERFPEREIGKYFRLIRRHGYTWNHKGVYRVHCKLKMNRRRIGKKRLPTRDLQPLAVPGTVIKTHEANLRKLNNSCGNLSIPFAT